MARCKKCGILLFRKSGKFIAFFGKTVDHPNILANFNNSLKEDSQLNRDGLYPCNLCPKCFSEWNKRFWDIYLSPNIPIVGDKNYNKFWDTKFREWLGEETLVFI